MHRIASVDVSFGSKADLTPQKLDFRCPTADIAALPRPNSANIPIAVSAPTSRADIIRLRAQVGLAPQGDIDW
jgi:hypothetical protein